MSTQDGTNWLASHHPIAQEMLGVGMHCSLHHNVWTGVNRNSEPERCVVAQYWGLWVRPKDDKQRLRYESSFMEAWPEMKGEWLTVFDYDGLI